MCDRNSEHGIMGPYGIFSMELWDYEEYHRMMKHSASNRTGLECEYRIKHVR